MRSLAITFSLICAVAISGFGCTKAIERTPMNTEPTTESITPLINGAYTVNAEQSTIAWSGKKAITPPHTGKVSISFADLMVENNQPIAGTIAINMQSITSDENLTLLVEHLKNEDFFAAETYPTSTFTLATITNTATPPNTNYLVTGNLKIRDIEKQLSFPLEVTQIDEQISVMGTIVINRADFDIRYNSSSFFENLGDKLIEDNFTLTLNLTFDKM